MTDTLPACYFPPRSGGTWDATSPEEAGWDPDLLEAAVAFAGKRNSTAFLVLRGGRILTERYWGSGAADVPADVASAQKSVTSALVGIARHLRLLDPGAPSSELLGEGWSQAPRQHEQHILLAHHLSMTTGLAEDLSVEAAPGTAWAYNNRTYHILKNGIERVTGRPLDEWSREVLWEPIGMLDTSWVVRTPPPGSPRVIFAHGPEDAPFSALVTTVRDMGRFGLLMANRGEWAQVPVIADEEYVRASITSSQALNPAYGFLWWLNTPGPFILPIRQPMPKGPFIPSAPPDLFCALGLGDQKIYVCPSLDIVVARQGQSGAEPGAARSSFDQELWSRLMAAAPASPPGPA